ncbi:hypothetical protein QD55_003636 [Salmonella enterica subsp. enterica serovar Ohio]|nr:hypothetical protein [Salmonella enterica subsp. enterica serovar Ohio]
MTDRKKQNTSMPSLTQQIVAASRIGNGAPLFYSAHDDLAGKGDDPATSYFDSYFFSSHVTSGDDALDVLIHYMRLRPPVASGEPFVQVMLTVLDPVTHTSLVEEDIYKLEQTAFSNSELSLETPAVTVNGTADALRVKCDFPTLAADLKLSNRGAILSNLGNGLLPLYGDIDYEYAFPDMDTEGSVTINGKVYEVSGSTWFDRQWGPLASSFWARHQWSWMGIVLDNGIHISLWDIVEHGGSHAFATVLHPDGRHEIVDVDPLDKSASGHWTSPQTGNTYPTEWDVSIPQLKARFKVVPHVREQEIPSKLPMNHKYEAASRLTGEMMGQPVDGRAVVELVGVWK